MKTNWIPTSERLPEESGKVLTCSATGYMDVVNYSQKNKQFNSFDVLPVRDNGFDDTIAWMPLPEPYKEEKSNG